MRDVACCRFASSSTPRYCNCAGGGSSPRFWRPRIRVTVLSVRCENLCACLVLLLRILQSCRGRLTWHPPFPRFLVNVFVENPPRFVRLLFVSVLVFPGADVVNHTSPCWRAFLDIFPFFFVRKFSSPCLSVFRALIVRMRSGHFGWVFPVGTICYDDFFPCPHWCSLSMSTTC